MSHENSEIVVNTAQTQSALSAHVSSLALASLQPETQTLLLRMFADPYILEKDEKAALVAQLRSCVERYPQVSEVRVLLGMALCVNLEVYPAIDELQESVRLAPNSFIAQFKLGELWMRLRAMDKAEEHTRLASLLAQNIAQADLARKQAATIRTMKREGIERGGYKSPLGAIVPFLRRLWARRTSEPSVALDVQ
jgi:tetratricopeptide (TPR) repeat protein